MARIKTRKEIQILKEGGSILAEVLRLLILEIRPGLDVSHLNIRASEFMLESGGKPSFLHYKPHFALIPFPAALCVSINEEVVHAPANISRKLKDGDIVSIDIGMEYLGLFTDMAVTIGVGTITHQDRKLIRVTKEALDRAIEIVRDGVSLAEIGKVIQKYVEKENFSVIRSLVGHGVGHAVHEEPAIPNYYDPLLRNERLKAGMVIALEPMVAFGSFEIIIDKDGWTVRTKDGRRAAHFEHTLAVTENGAQILTE